MLSSRNFIFQCIYFFWVYFYRFNEKIFIFILNFLSISENLRWEVKEVTEESQWPRKKLKLSIFSCQKHVLKVGFFQKVLAKFSSFSKCHSCEPETVPELLILVNDHYKILVILWIDLVIKSPHFKIWLKSALYAQVKLFNMLAKLINY